jgi:tetratricopeptide (TPR) repeat protein
MFRNLRIIVVGALVALGLAGCKSGPEVKPDSAVTVEESPKDTSADKLFARGVVAFEADKLDEARELFEEVTKKAPQSVSAFYNLGVIAERQGQVGPAAAHYEAALAVDAEHTPTLLNLGKVYRLQGRFDQAITLYEAALKLPGREYDVALLNNLAVSYRLAKRYEDAEKALRRLLSRTKDNADAYKNLALVYYDQGRYKLAEFVSGTAKKLDEKDPGVYNNLGMIYLKTDQKALALGQFHRAVELKPDFAPGHMNIGAMALEYRDYEMAEKSFRKALTLDPNSPESHLFLAWALEGQKGRDTKKGCEAGAQFERYLTFRADSPEAICAAGWSYAADKCGWEKAIGFLERCKGMPTSTETDKQLIDGRIRGLQAMLKAGQAQQAAPEKREAPKKTGGPSLLDKAAAEDADAEDDDEAAEQTGEGGQ